VAVPEGTGWHEDGFSRTDGQHVDNFIADIEKQEGGDHHNTTGIIRAGIAAQLHMDMKPNAMHAITREYTARALNAWRRVPGLWLLGEGQGGFK
jgi:selenocysteine lyase/cysteine desulfurase